MRASDLISSGITVAAVARFVRDADVPDYRRSKSFGREGIAEARRRGDSFYAVGRILKICPQFA